MPEKTEIEAEVAAEKAYAAAAEAVAAKPAEPAPAAIAPAPEPVLAVEFPSKAKRAPKPTAVVPEAPKAPAPAAEKATAKPAKAKPAALKAAVVSRKAKPPVSKKTASAKPKALTTPKAKAPAKPKAAAPKAASGAAPKPMTKKSVFQQIKDKTMDTTEFTTKIKGAVTEAQAKAKEAFDKGAATFGEYNEFTKGNLEAVAASGKILAAGVQALGKTFVEDGKSAFETLTAEVKELAAVKSPADFFKLQAEFLRRNFDIAVANTSKNSEAVLKLANEVAAPISGRVNLVVEKVKKAA
ncbi:MAG: phasin family protein [Novosphingobium sp.]